MIRDHGPGGRWFVFAVAYPSARMAKRAWERVEGKLNMRAGDEGIGVYRLAPNPAGGAESGRENTHGVAVVTLDEPTGRKATRLLSDGEQWEPTPDFADALIYRRARVAVAHAGETGRARIRRPDGRGAQLDRHGGMHEHEPGRG